MKIIKNKVKISSEIERHIPNNSMFFDIETTGFSPIYNRIYMIGMLVKEKGEYIAIQYLTENKADEAVLLRSFSDFIKPYDVLISFNGDSFDLRFTAQRMERLNINSDLTSKVSFDILKYIREEGFLLELENQKLKTLERYLGIFRDDLYSGGELISKYYEYEAGDISQEPILLLHNLEDIINMPALFRFIDIIDEKNTLILKDNSFRIQSLALDRTALKIGGLSNISRAYYNQGESGELKIKESRFFFKRILKSGNYDEKTKCSYLELNGANLNCSYGIKTPNNLLLIKHGKNLLYSNAVEYFKYFLKNNI